MSRSRVARMLRPLAGLALALGLGGCASASMTSIWREPGYADPVFAKPLVVALRSNPVYRRTWEDAFVAGLKLRGVAATPSYQLFPDALPDTQQVIAAVRANQFDDVIVSVRLPNVEEKNYVPPTTRREPVTVHDDWSGRYHTYWREVTTAGRTEVSEIRRFQTDVWTARTTGGRLVWSGTVETDESITAPLLSEFVRKSILPAMEKATLIPPVTKP